MSAAAPPDMVAHALNYPFAPPAFSFHLSSGAGEARRLRLRRFSCIESGAGVVPLCDLDVEIEGQGARRFHRRVPVIASGSNASPTRLRGKFAQAGVSADFPVLRTRVSGLVPVYSAHISKYGSIPGTLMGEGGARAMLAIAFLSAPELDVLNASEGLGNNYGLGLIAPAQAELGAGMRLGGVLAYISRRGAFAPDGAPLRISAFNAYDSALRAAGQRRILHHARRIVGAREGLRAFVLRQVEDGEERQRCTAILARHAQPCAMAGLHCVAGGLDAPAVRLPDGW